MPNEKWRSYAGFRSSPSLQGDGGGGARGTGRANIGHPRAIAIGKCAYRVPGTASIESRFALNSVPALHSGSTARWETR